MTKVELVRYPTMSDLVWVKKCALGTAGYEIMKTEPDTTWLYRMADAEHSPIRELTFSYVITDLPYWVSNELCRHHVGVEKYVKSQRNDRQRGVPYDRAKAPQEAPVNVRITLNCQALINLAHKRLCGNATKEMQQLTHLMCTQAVIVCPWLEGILVPMCVYRGGKCHEMVCCGRSPWAYDYR